MRERVRVVCMFIVCSSRVRRLFSCIRRPFSACPSNIHHLYTMFNARFALAFALNENGKGTLIKGVAFGCTQSGGAPRFRALARTLHEFVKSIIRLAKTTCI